MKKYAFLEKEEIDFHIHRIEDTADKILKGRYIWKTSEQECSISVEIYH